MKRRIRKLSAGFAAAVSRVGFARAQIKATVSPPLGWSGESECTKGFAVSAENQNIPAAVNSPEQDVKAVGIPDTNNFGDRGYNGPCPQPGREPRIHVFSALDLPTLNLKAGKSRDALDQAMRKHVLTKAELRLRYAHQ